jgi:hypothetical protein
MACRASLGLNQRDQPPACWSRLPAGRTGQYRGDFVPATSTVCGVQDSGKDGAVSAGTVLHNVRIGVSWIQRQIGQKSFCRKDKKGFG